MFIGCYAILCDVVGLMLLLYVRTYSIGVTISLRKTLAHKPEAEKNN